MFAGKARDGFLAKFKHFREIEGHGSRRSAELEGAQELFGEEGGLGGADFLQAFLREDEEALELVVAEGGFFAGALNFDELTLAGHDDVEVHFGVLVFQIRDVEELASGDDADADGGDGIGEGVVVEFFRVEKFLDGEAGGEVGAGDRGGAGAAVGLKNVAVEPEGVLAEFAEVDDGAEGAADEALDLDGAAVDLAAGDVTGFALVRAVGEHRILGGQPATLDALLLHPGGDAGFDGGGADDACFAVADEDRASGVRCDVRFEGDGAELIVGAAVEAGGT